ncbi:ATP-dependent zinc metalloprotease FtsH [Streptacidiphilus sp. P02-A3a]|uniref:ATP-dependent zinc metalloprotease FtsH n=1 Tax=Streptacidiphilus sp. P02-A3a TaxID=2704468 RepID=UPI0015F922C5|nr:ATP-dependent zinc metalloprotease FtsH [Streptacidiphilus sp. P02-A3a]QMU72338.1 ATP-dependent zinc metalloprotease FtsH [Streptacidiphilus sp. P02-A3a]
MTTPAPPRDTPEKPWRSEGAPPPPPQQPKPPRISWIRLVLFAVVVYLLADLLLSLFGNANSISVTYTEFSKQLNAGQVAEIYAKGDTIQGKLKSAQPKPDNGKGSYTDFTTQRPVFAEDNLWATLEAKGVVVDAEPVVKERSFLANLLISLAPMLLLVVLWLVIARRLGSGGMGGLGGLAKKGPPRPVTQGPGERRTTFADVAGIDEVKAELTEVVDFLKHPETYRRMGAKMPRGVLLAGPPGTGKTLLARAVAGEAGVPFFSASASEFVEMIVGVGASRVRELFTEARKVAPAIIFIDEIDTIGRARGGNAMGGHDEREQTLNQILTEMDGFSGSEGVVVIAATNRAEVLDPALLRPGRFDRTVTVSPPDREGRRAILAIHTREVPLAPDVDLEQVARITPGMTGADLANLANEAALLAVKRGLTQVGAREFSDALEKVQLGAKRSLVMPEEERRRTAYHESGHALLGMLHPGADPVRKITIVPRGRALGVTLSTPDADRYSYTEEYLRSRIIGALGGMAAEQVVYGMVTTGAESDLEQVTSIARGMAGRWGMSERVGRLTAIPNDTQGAYGLSSAPATLDAVDGEARRIVAECYAEACRQLTDHRPQLDALADALMDHETLDEEAAYRVAGMPRGGRG